MENPNMLSLVSLPAGSKIACYNTRLNGKATTRTTRCTMLTASSTNLSRPQTLPASASELGLRSTEIIINSASKVKEFHDTYPDEAGPPVRLAKWLEAAQKNEILQPTPEDLLAVKSSPTKRPKRHTK